MRSPFYRMGNPRVVPINGTDSALTPFNITLPSNVESFMFVNHNPCWVRLKGNNDGDNFVPVTNTTGWCIPPQSVMGPFRTQQPVTLSAQAYAYPGAPLPSDMTGATLELIYGSGE